MAVHLKHFDKGKYAQTLLDSAGFQQKNKIVVNNPAQTHVTIEGVQAYTHHDLKAMKERQDRLMDRKEGNYVEVKTCQLADQFIDQNIMEKKKETNKNNETTHKKPVKREFKTNARNAVSMNNGSIVKLEKEIAKKNALQRKLQKMSAKYKEFFKDVDLKEGLTTQKQKQDLDDSFGNISEPQSIKIENTTHMRTFKIDHKQEKESFDHQEEERQNPLDLGLRLVNNCSSYSEKLGTAVHELFK